MSAFTASLRKLPPAPRLPSQGFEHATEVDYPLQASTCCKHFVANELDSCQFCVLCWHCLFIYMHTCQPWLLQGTAPLATPLMQSYRSRTLWTRALPAVPQFKKPTHHPHHPLAISSYLPSFQTCVEDGKASGIMCSVS